MARVPLISDGAADPTARQVFDRVRSGGRELPDLYRALANAPQVLQLWVEFADGVRSKSTVPRATRELSIMRVALLEDVDYQWRHHWKLGGAAGLTDEQLKSIPQWKASSCFPDDQRATLRAADELVTDATLTTAAWDELRRHWSNSEAIEILLTISFYICASRMLRALDLQLEQRYLEVPSIAEVSPHVRKGE